MIDWIGDLENAGKIANLFLKIGEIFSNITTWIDDNFGWKILLLFLVLLPLTIKFTIWLIHEIWQFRP